MRNSAYYVRNTCQNNDRWNRCGYPSKAPSAPSRTGVGPSVPGTKTGTTRYDGECTEMQKELMALYFVMVELELYLDGHPNNTEALARYRCVSSEYDALAMQYQKQYGPLLARNIDTDTEWKWVKDPWPWEV